MAPEERRITRSPISSSSSLNRPSKSLKRPSEDSNETRMSSLDLTLAMGSIKPGTGNNFDTTSSRSPKTSVNPARLDRRFSTYSRKTQSQIVTHATKIAEGLIQLSKEFAVDLMGVNQMMVYLDFLRNNCVDKSTSLHATFTSLSTSWVSLLSSLQSTINQEIHVFQTGFEIFSQGEILADVDFEKQGWEFNNATVLNFMESFGRLSGTSSEEEEDEEEAVSVHLKEMHSTTQKFLEDWDKDETVKLLVTGTKLERTWEKLMSATPTSSLVIELEPTFINRSLSSEKLKALLKSFRDSFSQFQHRIERAEKSLEKSRELLKQVNDEQDAFFDEGELLKSKHNNIAGHYRAALGGLWKAKGQLEVILKESSEHFGLKVSTSNRLFRASWREFEEGRAQALAEARERCKPIASELQNSFSHKYSYLLGPNPVPSPAAPTKWTLISVAPPVSLAQSLERRMKRLEALLMEQKAEREERDRKADEKTREWIERLEEAVRKLVEKAQEVKKEELDEGNSESFGAEESENKVDVKGKGKLVDQTQYPDLVV